eukprot:gene11780-13673_t
MLSANSTALVSSGASTAEEGVSRDRSVLDTITRLRSLHNVTWDPSMESDLRILEANIVSAILPVRDKLHKQWQRMSQPQGLAGSCASSVSSSSVSSSTKTSKEDAVSDTPFTNAGGTGLTGATPTLSGSDNSELASSSKHKETSSKAKNSKGDKSVYTAHKPALQAGAGPGPAIFLAASTSSSAISRKLLRAGVPQAETVGNNCNNFPSFSIVKGVVVDTPWYDLVKRESKNNIHSRSSNNSQQFRVGDETFDDISVHSDCTGEENWGAELNLNDSGSTDIDFNADNLLESWGIYDTTLTQSINHSENTSVAGGATAQGSSSESETNKKRKVAESSAATNNATEIINTLSLPQQQLLRIIVPIPRGSRVAQYICSVCNVSYMQTVSSNPWWALYTHKCNHCKQLQIPRIDIGTWVNSVELDPYNAALYGDGVAEESS